MDFVGPVRKPITPDQFDVIVIGGGINGVAIARECARGGKRTLLLEQHDFASGTTSRATRIIHGGLRYLEHGELSLVRESLKERERLLKERPHLVRLQDFVLALPKEYGRRSALAIRFGLWLYRQAGGKRQSGFGHKSQLREFDAALDSGLNLNYFSYEDAQCSFPERLVAEWLTEAVQAGAIVRNHTKVLQIIVSEGKARGVVVRDLFTEQETEIAADWIINATGPWVDSLLHESGIHETRLVDGIRGSHLVIPSFPGAPKSALYTEAIDSRPIFLIPWADQLLLGTTEVEHNTDPGQAVPSRAEMQYLFLSLHRLFPSCGVRWGDVHYAYAGVRPLPYNSSRIGRIGFGSISRRHKLHDHLEHGIAGLITLIGGKLTTAAKVGRECARAIGARVADLPQPVIAVRSSDGIDNALTEWSETAAHFGHVSPRSAFAIAEWHGKSAINVVRLASSDAMLRHSLCEHTPHIVAEAVEAIRHEFAVSLADVLLRRVPVALGPCWDEVCTRTAARRIGEALRWPEPRINMEIEDFEIERSRFLYRIRADELPTTRPSALQPLKN
jgi:glycerol-3-phosphate dehydrogenase